MGYWLSAHVPNLRFYEEPVEVTIEEIQKNQNVRKTVVQRSAGRESDQAKKDSYLSDRTRVVKEERSASSPGELRGSLNPGSGAPAVEAPAPKRVKLADLGLKLSHQARADPRTQKNWAEPQTGEMLRGGQYIVGMKEGEFSALNTKEFVFYSYFERVRRQLDSAWQPILRANVQRLMKSGRHLASNSDYITRTLVTLNEKGEILRVQLIEESGTFDLDQAAVDALNKAGPYPNPPKGLIDSSGVVQIRWDFILRT